MLRVEQVTGWSPELNEIQALYCRSFPANERGSFGPTYHQRLGGRDFIAFYDGSVFCGFTILLTYRDITHILYIAVEEKLRDEGYGAQALRAIQEMFPHNRIIADVEAAYPDAPNYEQRKKRLDFYKRNGYIASPVEYDWKGERYVIMVANGNITESEFGEFWDFYDTYEDIYEA